MSASAKASKSMGMSIFGLGSLQFLASAILGIFALVMAIRHWKRYPTASMLVLFWGLFSLLSVVGTLLSIGYFALGIGGSGGGGSTPFVSPQIFFVVQMLLSLLLSFTPALLLFAVYAGRGGQAEQVSRQL